MINFWDTADPVADVYTSDTAALLDALRIPIEGYVLDVGCGPGRLLKPLRAAHPTAHIIGLDVSPNMVGDCPGVIIGDGETIPVTVDAAYSVNMFQHIDGGYQLGYLYEAAVKVRGLFRFQFVTRGERGPHSHPITVELMREMVAEADMRVVAVDDGLVHPDWCWMTVR
jgi:SAM-dependent methyltransferase